MTNAKEVSGMEGKDGRGNVNERKMRFVALVNRLKETIRELDTEYDLIGIDWDYTGISIHAGDSMPVTPGKLVKREYSHPYPYQAETKLANDVTVYRLLTEEDAAALRSLGIKEEVT